MRYRHQPREIATAGVLLSRPSPARLQLACTARGVLAGVARPTTSRTGVRLADPRRADRERATGKLASAVQRKASLSGRLLRSDLGPELLATAMAAVSPGCKHCYAETFAERFRGVRGHPYQ